MSNEKRFVVKHGLQSQNIEFISPDKSKNMSLSILNTGSISFVGNGNVGIGIATPATKLEVKGDIRAQASTATDYITLAHTGSNWGFLQTSGTPIAFYTGANERMRITAAGDVGIGTTTPTQKLDVTGNTTLRNSTTATNLTVHNTYTDASNYERAKIGWNTNVLEIGTENAGTGTLRNINLIGGNVGIGTSSPATRLDVALGSTSIRTKIVGDNPRGLINYIGTNGGDAFARAFYLGQNGSFSGHANQTFTRDETFTGAWGLSMVSGGTPYETTSEFKIVYQAMDGITYSRLNIGSSGNVGIGTTSPVSRLHVDGDFAFASNGSGSNWLKWERVTSNNWRLNSDGVGIVMTVIGNSVTIPQNVIVGRGGLSVERTVLSATPAIGVTETWNNANTTFTAISTNITDTASAVGSLLMDLQVGGASRAKVTKAGKIIGVDFEQTLGGSGFYTNGIFSYANYFNAYVIGSNVGISTGGQMLTRDAPVILADSGSANGVYLYRDAANILAQRNGTNSQTSRIYNTYTDASNYERAKIGWNTNVLEIGTENAGTGTLRNINLIGGKVGISTSIPKGTLSIFTTALSGTTDYDGNNFGIVVGTNDQSDVGNDGNGIVFTQQYATDAVDGAQVRTGAIIGYKGQASGSFGGGLKFLVQPTGANPMSTTMTLTKDSNVGIGTTSPSYKLHVVGSAGYFDSGLRLGSGYSAIDVATGVSGLYLSGSQGALNHLFISPAGNLGIGSGTPSAKLDVAGDIEVNSNVNLNSEATTLATVTKTQVASFPVASFRSGKLIVQAYDSVTGEVQISELLVAHNGTTASATEYGVVFTGTSSIVIYDVDISAGNVRLMATRTTANSTQYKTSETLMVA